LISKSDGEMFESLEMDAIFRFCYHWTVGDTNGQKTVVVPERLLAHARDRKDWCKHVS